VNTTDLSQLGMREGIADYRFIRALGTGNNGVFYLARRPERLPVNDDLVAVKVLSGTSSQDTFRRATRELAAFAAVNSPYLVTLYDAGQAGSEMYYSLEYVAGGSLAHPAAQPPRSAVLAAVAHAARAAHSGPRQRRQPVPGPRSAAGGGARTRPLARRNRPCLDLPARRRPAPQHHGSWRATAAPRSAARSPGGATDSQFARRRSRHPKPGMRARRQARPHPR